MREEAVALANDDGEDDEDDDAEDDDDDGDDDDDDAAAAAAAAAAADADEAESAFSGFFNVSVLTLTGNTRSIIIGHDNDSCSSSGSNQRAR